MSFPKIGVLGGGQLGRMLGLAGIPLGAKFVFLDSNPLSPAADVGELILGGYDDTTALDKLIDAVDVVTYEFENVPVATAEYVAARKPVWPPPSVLSVAQDRLKEKEFFQSLGIPTAPFYEVNSLEDLHKAVKEIGSQGVLKTRTMGYDGKGQFRIRSESDVDTAWNEIGGVPLIYEGFVNFKRELSILGVRNQKGEVAFYPLVENVHNEGILRLSVAPAKDVDALVQKVASDYSEKVLNAFGYVGVLAIELFDTEDGLVANEMAPRVHNSGHWTIEGSEISQFENHIRAVCDLPLGSTSMVGYAAMLNVIGDLPKLGDLLEVPNTHVHMYAKSEAPRRKLGHVTVRSPGQEALQECLALVRRILVNR